MHFTPSGVVGTGKTGTPTDFLADLFLRLRYWEVGETDSRRSWREPAYWRLGLLGCG